MVAAGEREIVEVLTVADGERPGHVLRRLPPALAEFAGPATPVHAAGPDGVLRTFSLGELLPASFGAAHLA